MPHGCSPGSIPFHGAQLHQLIVRRDEKMCVEAYSVPFKFLKANKELDHIQLYKSYIYMYTVIYAFSNDGLGVSFFMASGLQELAFEACQKIPRDESGPLDLLRRG